MWQRERATRIASIREANTRPGTLAARTFNSAVYGDHPYGADTNAESLGRIAVTDMAAFHARHVVACRVRVSLVGALNRQQAEALVTTAIGLFAAIPAVVAFNRFARDIDRIASQQETFIEEFSNILQRNVGAQASAAAGGGATR